MQHPDSDQIAAFVLGELPEAERAACEAHFQVCGECLALLQSEQSLRRLLKLDDISDAPKADSRRIIEQMDELTPEGRQAIRRRLWNRRGAQALGVAAIVTILILMRPVNDKEEETLALEMGISTSVQRDLVTNLDALRVLREEPWLADEEFETDQFLVELIRQREGD